MKASPAPSKPIVKIKPVEPASTNDSTPEPSAPVVTP